MVVCKFWLENRCKYGTACRFEHTKAGSQGGLFGANNNWQGGGGGGGQRVSFQNSFGNSGNQYKWTANQAQGQEGNLALDAVNGLPEEMKRWEESKMWPFSCVSIEKDLPSLPDFPDLSVEEMRFEAYQCKAQGSMEPYIKKYQALTLEFQNKRRQLQHMTMDLKQKLVTFVEEGRRKKTMQPTSSGFGAAAQTSAGSGLFGRTSQPSGGSGSAQGSLFGGSSGNSSTANSVFSNNKFGVLASGSTFGESAGGSSGGSLFGKPISNSGGAGSLFGSGNQNNNQLTSLLGAAPTASPGMFPTQGSQPNPGLFSSGAAASGQSSAPNVFGYSARQTAPNLFGASSNPAMAPAGSSNGLFGKQGATPTAQTSLLGQGPTGLGQVPSLFGKQIPGGNTQTSLLSTPPSLFGTPATGPTPSSQTSLLGPAPTSQSPFFGGKGNNSVFGGTQGQSTPQGAPNLFGKPSPGFGGGLAPHAQPGGNNSGPGLFGKGGPQLGSDNTSDESSTLFTPLSDLTESEKAAFEAKAFTLGKIPIRPPPKELVNV